ncbi:MAG: hypothetical protein OEW64_01215 [Gammaproteobacteria bacterium]|nr:hypothetical protein [Gammaproteobacteria bacterium]MDH5302699.1 hypothetical protein [Gammaproteobacteria bacterium]
MFPVAICIAVPVAIFGVWVARKLPDFVLLAAYSALVSVLAVSLWQRARKSDRFYGSGVPYGMTIVDSRGEQYSYDAPVYAPRHCDPVRRPGNCNPGSRGAARRTAFRGGRYSCNWYTRT